MASTSGEQNTASGGANDDDELADLQEDVYAMIRESLADAIKHKSRHGRRNSEQLDLRIKLEYLGEKRSIQMRRPISFKTIGAKIKEMYGKSLTMYYTVTNSEIIVPINSQEGLDKAVGLVEKSAHMRSLRLLLSQHSETNSTSITSEAKTDRTGSVFPKSGSPNSGRFSPPPGQRKVVDDSSRRYIRKTSKASSRRSEGALSSPGLEDVVEIPYMSSASSHASSRLSNGSPNCGSFGLGGRRPIPGYSNHGLRWPGSAGGRHGSHASSSSSSGLVPDIDGSVEGRRLSATSPRAPSNWRQGRCLGSGAFGQVFLCYDADTGRELAVKRVIMHTSDNNQQILRREVASLENEITLLRNMQHERIVQYFGFDRDQDALCIFMEYMPGGSVKDEIKQYGPLTETVARKYTKQIIEGLNYLHHYDIIHRDIKTANILRDSEGNVKIGDFGSGKRLQTICTQSQAGSFIGTPYYMAPEVIQGKRYGRKADIWSLGCTLLEMLTGNPPWNNLEPMAAIFRIAFEQPQYTLPERTSVELKSFLELLFTRNPEKRPYAYQALQLPAMQEI